MKKIIIAVIAAAVTATSFADSFAVPAAPAQPVSNAHAYFELASGYAVTNFVNFDNKLSPSDFVHPNGGFAFGVDAGYVFMPHLGVEVGYMTPLQNTAWATDHTMNRVAQHSFYGAARIETSLGQPNFSLFALAGFGYTKQTFTAATGGPVKQSSACGFVGGVGVNYIIAHNFTIGARYMRAASRDNNSVANNAAFPAPQYYLVTLGYRFNM